MRYIFLTLIVLAASCRTPEENCMQSCKYVNPYNGSCGVNAGYSGYEYKSTEHICRCWVENK